MWNELNFTKNSETLELFLNFLSKISFIFFAGFRWWSVITLYIRNPYTPAWQTRTLIYIIYVGYTGNSHVVFTPIELIDRVYVPMATPSIKLTSGRISIFGKMMKEISMSKKKFKKSKSLRKIYSVYDIGSNLQFSNCLHTNNDAFSVSVNRFWINFCIWKVSSSKRITLACWPVVRFTMKLNFTISL